jgi:hypothetical protein
LGGLKTTLDSEVLHVSGEPIAGLFAAGRCTAGLAAWGYAAGSRLATAASTGAAPAGPPPRAEPFRIHRGQRHSIDACCRNFVHQCDSSHIIWYKQEYFY